MVLVVDHAETFRFLVSSVMTIEITLSSQNNLDAIQLELRPLLVLHFKE